MKRLTISLTVVAFLVVSGLSMSAVQSQEKEDEKKFEYISAAKCKTCHSKPKMGGAEYLKWEKGKHAKAYESLLTERAKEIADQAGVASATDEQCLVCHITSMEIADKPEIVKEGVGCETCHGPGSEYRSMKVMKDYEESVKNGMTDYHGETDEETMKNIETQCRSCHGLEHKDTFPAAKEFNFKEAWAKIKHDEETLKKEFPEAFE